MEALHEGALVILSHWHYYKRGLEPLKMDWKKGKGQTAIWSKLTEAESEHIIQACAYYQGKAKGDEAQSRISGLTSDLTGDLIPPIEEEDEEEEEDPQIPGYNPRWNDNHYWTRQMFEENWQPGQIFSS